MNRSRTRPAPRIARDVPMPKRGPDPKRSAGHLNFVRSRYCCKCGRPPRSHAHHENYDLPDNAMARKAADRTVVPLCLWCHERRHKVGAISFWGDTDIPKSLMDALWRNSGDDGAGDAAVFRAWQKMNAMRLSARHL